MESKIEVPALLTLGTKIQIIIGAFLVAIGLLLVAGNLGLVNTTPLLDLWPLVLVAIGAMKLYARSGAVFSVVLIVAGIWMTGSNLGWIRVSIFELWPLIIILCGVAMVGRAIGSPLPLLAGAPRNSWSIFSSRKVVETASDYHGGDAVAIFGGCEIDLSNAKMTNRPAVIDATALIGGIDILVPDDWRVTGEVVPVMGGFDVDCRSSTSTAGGELIVRGVALMGAIEVKSVRRTA